MLRDIMVAISMILYLSLYILFQFSCCLPLGDDTVAPRPKKRKHDRTEPASKRQKRDTADITAGESLAWRALKWASTGGDHCIVMKKNP